MKKKRKKDHYKQCETKWFYCKIVEYMQSNQHQVYTFKGWQWALFKLWITFFNILMGYLLKTVEIGGGF